MERRPSGDVASRAFGVWMEHGKAPTKLNGLNLPRGNHFRDSGARPHRSLQDHTG